MEDVAIIALYWERSEEAITQTDQKYGALCRSIARNMLHRAEDVEECLNDTYLGAWNAMPPERPRALCAFLLRIAKNNALKKIEYSTAQKRGGQMDVSLSELEECLPSGARAEEHAELAELTGTINRFLRAQSRQNRQIFIRRYWFFDSIADIAALFGLSEGKTKTLLFRMRGKLRAQLVGEGYPL